MQYRINFWHFATLIAFIACLIIGILTYCDFGISWDFEAHDTYGQQVVSFYKTFGEDQTSIWVPMKIFGGGFEIFSNIIRYLIPGDYYELKNLATFLMAAIGIVGAIKCAVEISGIRAGFFTLIFLSVIPVYFGHSFINSKDIPVAVGYIWSLWSIIKIQKDFPNITLINCIYSGLAIGFLLSVRAAAAFFFGVFGAGYALIILQYFIINGDLKVSYFFKKVATVTLFSIGTFLIAWIIMCILWPYALIHPIQAPLEVILESSKFHWNFPLRFNGEMYVPPSQPKSYIPMWYALQFPEYIFAALLIGIILLTVNITTNFKNTIKSVKTVQITTLLFAILFPILLILYKNSIIYDAIRHLLFTIPIICVISAVAFDTYLKNTTHKNIKYFITTIFTALIALCMFDSYSVHPYQYAYVNRIIGGTLSNSYDKYENDYWATCMKESVEWIANNTTVNSNYKTVIAGWADNLQIKRFVDRFQSSSRPDMTFSANEIEANYYITTNRFNGHIRTGEMIHKISRQNAPLCYIFRLR